MKRCDTERKELKTELKHFSSHEGQMKRLFTYQIKEENRHACYLRLKQKKVNVEDAAKFAELMSNGKPALRKRLYQKALLEYQDEELIMRKDEQIEKYLNRDFLLQEHMRFGKTVKKEEQ